MNRKRSMPVYQVWAAGTTTDGKIFFQVAHELFECRRYAELAEPLFYDICVEAGADPVDLQVWVEELLLIGNLNSLAEDDLD